MEEKRMCSMVLVAVRCPYCNSDNVIKNGKNTKGKQVYICKNQECDHITFPEEYIYNACEPKIKEKIFDLTVNGNGTRAIARILGISTNTVTSELKKNNLSYGK